VEIPCWLYHLPYDLESWSNSKLWVNLAFEADIRTWFKVYPRTLYEVSLGLTGHWSCELRMEISYLLYYQSALLSRGSYYFYLFEHQTFWTQFSLMGCCSYDSSQSILSLLGLICGCLKEMKIVFVPLCTLFEFGFVQILTDLPIDLLNRLDLRFLTES
jgi:hypothetical protein